MEEIKYIVTNTCLGGEYTPSVFITRTAAKNWIKEVTAENIRNAYEYKCKDLEEMSDMKVIDWAKRNIAHFVFTETSSFISYSDDAYNAMQLYCLKDIA